MNTKQKNKKLFTTALGLFLLAAGSVVLVASTAQPAMAAGCGGATTNIIECDEADGIGSLLAMAIKIMAAGVGILAVGGIAYGAVLYASAGDKQDQVKKATTIITNTVIGLLVFGFMFAIINFLIPGNVLS